MTYFFLYPLLVILLVLFWRWLVKGRLINFFYLLAVVLSALLDMACQLWLDVEKIWKRGRKVPDLDVTDDYYFRD